MNKPLTAVSNLGAIDAAHHLHPFSDMKKLNASGTKIITRAEGVHIWDSTGKQYLDAFAGLWCVNVGYGRKSIADVVHAQMLELPYYNTFFGTTTPPTTLLAQKIAEKTGPKLNRVFFSNSGSEASDTWFRMARVYWKALGHETKTQVIARKNAYHGSTVAGASLGGMKWMHEQGNLPIEGIHHINQPYWYAEGGDLSPEDFGLKVARELEEKIIELGEENVAAFVAEPIQGAGGVIVPPSTYWPEIKRICAKYQILLVADEVISGFGRLGSWFGHQHYDFEPDLAPIAKGLSSGYLPIGGVLVSDRVAEVMVNELGDFYHGYTYSGHPVALASLTEHELVGEAVSVGLMGAVQITADKATRRRFKKPDDTGTGVRNQCVNAGVVLRATGDRMLFSPPLIISRSEIDQAVDTLRSGLDWLKDNRGEG